LIKDPGLAYFNELETNIPVLTGPSLVSKYPVQEIALVFAFTQVSSNEFKSGRGY